MATSIVNICSRGGGISIGRYTKRELSICTRQLRKHMISTSADSPEVQKSDDEKKNRQTHFGYQTVLESEKEKKVHKVFENVSSKYDCMNDLMSGGIHRLWKDVFMDRLGPTQDTYLLDVAGGTGDIAFRFLKHVEVHYGDIENDDVPGPIDDVASDGMSLLGSRSGSPEGRWPARVVVCDINQAMLDVGRRRAQSMEKLDGSAIKWVCGNAEELPFEDDKFDAYTIAFGIRNVVHIDKVLEEAYRVLKPGGRFMCLEFSHVRNPLLKWLYDGYSMNVIPVMGQLVAGDWASYQYLVESIRKFPDQDEFAAMIKDAGFRHVNFENLTNGMVAIHSGFKL